MAITSSDFYSRFIHISCLVCSLRHLVFLDHYSGNETPRDRDFSLYLDRMLESGCLEKMPCTSDVSVVLPFAVLGHCQLYVSVVLLFAVLGRCQLYVCCFTVRCVGTLSVECLCCFTVRCVGTLSVVCSLVNVGHFSPGSQVVNDCDLFIHFCFVLTSSLGR